MRMTKADKEAEKRCLFLRSLLKKFGGTLHSFDPGVSVFIPGNYEETVVHLDGLAWKWLEPLLVELLEFRRKSR